ncbi:Uncharacterized protein PECH_003445 [Penicillium ucsense]|uniref:Uncharacterized protein n=1 Tax=Penicillium ucsense TaxID=2839758 RepID=A0A8J8WBN9_9EURO|nr:Uncharacterized protein PECM_000255 [Penicillium ucsense]KAF7739465.1 Uncharacterized protein PECH_003445 [Penicillium ucsense]
MDPKIETKVEARNLPSSLEEWMIAAGAYKRRSIHVQRGLLSGSKIDRSQYLHLRVLWENDIRQEACDRLNLGKFHDEAKGWLAKFDPFQRHLDRLKCPTAMDDPADIFYTAYRQQEQVMKFFRKGVKEQGLRRLNEQIVNTSLVCFLDAICGKHARLKKACVWTPQNAGLTANFPKAAMVCKLDGYLCSDSTSQTHLILEAKPNRREKHSPTVYWQEAAELVAALRTPLPKGLKRDMAVLISQDGDQLYIAKAFQGATYLEYLERTEEPKQPEQLNELDEAGFLRIEQWGPWNIAHPGDVEEFAGLLLAIVLRAFSEDTLAETTG